MSRRPKRSTVRSTSGRSAASSPRCVGTPSASPPMPTRWRSVSAQASGLRLATTTFAPAATKPSAIARPIPRVPPVTIATRPPRSKSRRRRSRSMLPPAARCDVSAAARSRACPPSGARDTVNRYPRIERGPDVHRLQRRAGAPAAGAARLLREAPHTGRARRPRPRARHRSQDPGGPRADGPRRLALLRLAEGVRRPGSLPGRPLHLLRRVDARDGPRADAHDQHRGPDADALRDGRAEALLPAEDREGGDRVLHRLLRAERRHRPRLAPDPRGPGGRPLRRERPEDLDQPRAGSG